MPVKDLVLELNGISDNLTTLVITKEELCSSMTIFNNIQTGQANLEITLSDEILGRKLYCITKYV